MTKRTIIYNNQPKLIATSTIGGPKECEGKIGKYIEKKLVDDRFGEKTYEKAECKMLDYAIGHSIKNAKLLENEISAILSGDLLNQIISSSYACRDYDVPYIGVYNACATMSEAFALGGIIVDGGYMQNVVCATGSHFSSAERQYRYPLELGSVRPPEAQWTVTGAGAGVLSLVGEGPKLIMATFGKVIDFGIKDANNMGSAMAPAAADTLITNFKENNLLPSDYDLIITGDLGVLGSKIFKDLVWEKGYDIEKQHIDCGELVYTVNEEEYQGGSGAGCSALVFNSYIYNELKKKKVKKVLLLATGALLSTTAIQQGESIPCVAHAVVFEA